MDVRVLRGFTLVDTDVQISNPADLLHKGPSLSICSDGPFLLGLPPLSIAPAVFL
jgi:hypothetical protein